MTSSQNARKTDAETPVAAWWRVMFQSQQIMQDNAERMMEQMMENHKRMIRLCFSANLDESNADSKTDSKK